MQKTCDLAFFRLSQNFLLTKRLSYQKILLAGNSGHIYGQLLLVTFFVSDYFEKSTMEDGELACFTVETGEFGCEKLQYKIKFEFLAGK